MERGADLPDWRVILATLVEHTPDARRWLDNAVNVTVPENAGGELLLGVDNNIWSIAFRHGCSVAFRNTEEDGNGEQRFVLSGPINGIIKTAGDILQVAPIASLESTTKDLDIPPQLSELDTASSNAAPGERIDTFEADGTSRVRKAMVERRGRIVLTMNAKEVPRPEKWTVASFNDFVQYLTSAEMPNHLHRLMYDRRKDHIETVIEVLSSIFVDPECRHAISRKACNAAMQYFVATNRIADARCLFVRMEMINFQMDTETFNILLRGAAKNNDLSNFQLILDLMLRRNHIPNSGTFIAFIQAFTDIRIKTYIGSVMENKHLLSHKSALRDACESIVRDEIEVSLLNNQTEEAFMAQMDSRYGSDWLTVGSGNRILHALGSRWLISRCWSFVMEMKARFVEPDNVSLNTILHHCKHMKNLEGAVEVIRNWPADAQFGLPMDQMSYHTLFEMAWRLRMHNVARVVWRYACLDAATTARMRTIVYNSVKVGVGLAMVPSRSQIQRLKSKPDKSEIVVDGNQDYLRLLEVVAETTDQPSEKVADPETMTESQTLAENPAPDADAGVITPSPTPETSTNSRSSGTELNQYGHVPNPNSVGKTFNRTAGLFITGINDFASHPIKDLSPNLETSSKLSLATSYQPCIRTPTSLHLYPRVMQAPSLASILASTVSTVHCAEPAPADDDSFTDQEKTLAVQRQMEMDRAVWQEWVPVEDFKEALRNAYERDMEWTHTENAQDARNLEWMLERKVDVLVRKRRCQDDRVKRWG